MPLIIPCTKITTTDWSLSSKTGATLNTCITLVNETTSTPVLGFSGAGAQTATLLLTAVADNATERGCSETLTLALGPVGAGTNGFDLERRMTNGGGGADPDHTKKTFSITINTT